MAPPAPRPAASPEERSSPVPGAGGGVFAAGDLGGGGHPRTWLSNRSEVGRHPEAGREVVRNEVILCELLSKTENVIFTA